VHGGAQGTVKSSGAASLVSSGFALFGLALRLWAAARQSAQKGKNRAGGAGGVAQRAGGQAVTLGEAYGLGPEWAEIERGRKIPGPPAKIHRTHSSFCVF